MISTATETTYTCPKCHGAKRFPTLAHVADGVCFRCAGAGVVDVLEIDERPRATRTMIADGTYGVICFAGGAGFCGQKPSFVEANRLANALRREHGATLSAWDVESDATCGLVGDAKYVVVKVVDGRWRTRSGRDFGEAATYAHH